MPWGDLTEKRPSRRPELVRYAEVRALVGGVTAIQGASEAYPDKEEALVRNVDLPIFGRDRARSLVDMTDSQAQKVRADLDSGKVTNFYVHLAEGVDEESRDELNKLIEYDLLRGETVIIHGTALTEEQLGHVRDAGAKKCSHTPGSLGRR